MNVTIDDTFGDALTKQVPQYAPDRWIPRSGTGPCNSCAALPDASYTFEGTWHDASTPSESYSVVPSTISMDFSGTRIYVFFILFNNIPSPYKNTRLRFYLDGSSNIAGEFLHLNDLAGPQYLYNQPVFISGALEPANHTLLISSYSDGTDGSVALFDYAVYTYSDEPEDPTPQIIHTVTLGPEQSQSQSETATPVQDKNATPRHSPRLEVVVGCSIAGVAVLALLLATLYWISVRRRRAPIRPFTTRPQPQGNSLPPPTEKWAEKVEEKEKVVHREQEGVKPPASDESAQLRSELGRVREELERVRGVAEPPKYNGTDREGVSVATVSK